MNIFKSMIIINFKMKKFVYLIFFIIDYTKALKCMFRQIKVNYKRKFCNYSKKYIIDIDGTICNTNNSDYFNSKPNYVNINFFNNLYEKGNEINYWTARGANSGINWDEFTQKQLESWNVKYDSINMGKPHYDYWIDDKAINVNDI